MHYEVEIGGRLRRIDITRSGDDFAVAIDGRTRQITATRIDAHQWSLLVSAPGKSDTPGRRVTYDVAISVDPAGALTVHVGSTPVAVIVNGRRRWGPGDKRHDGAGAGSGPQRVAAPMPGKVVRVLVAQGEVVRARQPLVVVEAMKMENELRAGRDGTVSEIHAREGVSVEAGALLIVIQ
ncbi:MAG: biotin/lipoyl-binding protein [Acidobacteria bacterium]|nr:biotin/lipoyl-binding protein [Acidobacteriota bacterium]